MTEEKRQMVEEPKQTEPKETDDTVTLRKGEVEGYKTQLKQAKKEREDLARRLDEIDKAKAAENADKLKAAEKFGELEKSYQAERDKLAAEVSALKRSHLIERARNSLLAAGMRPGLAIDGAVSALPAEFDADAISEWVGGIKAAHPSEFGAAVIPIGSPSAGSVSRTTGDEVAQLKADWEKALKTSPQAAKDVKARIDKWMRDHPGKNPLV